MADLSHWEYAEDFSLHEVAYLIMGIDPNGPDDGTRFPNHIYTRIETAFTFAKERAKFDAFLVNALDAEEAEEAERALPPKSQCLRSKEMEWRYQSLMDGNEIGFIGWVENNGFDYSAKFTRKEISRWLRENSLKSVYVFEAQTGAPDISSEKPLTTRERTNLLNIIGALLGLNGTKETAIIAELLEKYPNTQGIKKRTLEEKFAEAKRVLGSN